MQKICKNFHYGIQVCLEYLNMPFKMLPLFGSFQKNNFLTEP